MEPKGTGQPSLGGMPTLPGIDWKRVEANFEIQVSLGLQEFRRAIERLFREKAELELHTSSHTYLKGVSVQVVKDGVEALITGWLPVAMEEGTPRYDLKPGFLRGRQWRIIPVGELGAPRFRTVSRNSPADSWWHPGVQARYIGEQVKEAAGDEAERIFNPLFERIQI